MSAMFDIFVIIAELLFAIVVLANLVVIVARMTDIFLSLRILSVALKRLGWGC